MCSTQLQILGQASATAASAVFVYFHFFRAGDGKEYTDVREQKKTVLLAQMSQVLKWNDQKEGEDKKGKDGDENKQPTPQELSDLKEVFDIANYDGGETLSETELDTMSKILHREKNGAALLEVYDLNQDGEVCGGPFCV